MVQKSNYELNKEHHKYSLHPIPPIRGHYIPHIKWGISFMGFRSYLCSSLFPPILGSIKGDLC